MPKKEENKKEKDKMKEHEQYRYFIYLEIFCLCNLLGDGILFIVNKFIDIGEYSRINLIFSCFIKIFLPLILGAILTHAENSILKPRENDKWGRLLCLLVVLGIIIVTLRSFSIDFTN